MMTVAMKVRNPAKSATRFGLNPATVSGDTQPVSERSDAELLGL